MWAVVNQLLQAYRLWTTPPGPGEFRAWHWMTRIVVPVVLSVALVQGRNWARYLSVVLCVIVSGTLILMLFFIADSWQAYVAGGIFAALAMIAGSVLWASRSVDAYFVYRTKQRL